MKEGSLLPWSKGETMNMPDTLARYTALYKQQYNKKWSPFFL